MNSKIGTWESVSALGMLAMTPLLLGLPTNLSEHLGTGAVLNSIYISVIFFVLFFILMSMLSKFKGKDILDVSEELGGTVLKYVTGIIYLIYFSVALVVATNKFSEELKSIIYVNSPLEFVNLIGLVGMVVGVYFGLKTIFRTSGLIFPIILISIIALFWSLRSKIDITNIFPLFGNDLKTFFLGGATRVGRYAGFVIFFFFNGYIEKPKKSALLAIALTSLMIIISLFLIFTIIPYPSTTETLIPIFELARLVSFERFFQRVDSIFTLIWILAAYVYVSITGYLILYILKKLFNIRYSNRIIPLIGLIALASSSIITKFTLNLQIRNYIYQYITPFPLIVYPMILLICATIKKLGGTDEKVQAV